MTANKNTAQNNTGPIYEPYDFANRRHIGPSPVEIEEMLSTVGVDDLEALI